MKRRIKSSAKGFTLIELLVVVIIIGILAAIALPNFIGVQNKARDASVKANMRTTQIASEAYATDNGGTYDSQFDVAIESYFPGGGSDGTTAGNAPVNPFTNASAWTDYGISLTITTVASARGASGGTLGNAGQIGYTALNNQTGLGYTSYAIEGANENGKALAGNANGTTLVLSNQ